jgi:phosphotransferase system HPr (HPr) family protein
MNGQPHSRKVTLTNPLGLHMRPMSTFVQIASKFQSQVAVIRPDGERVDGKSMFGLMSLAAEQGTELTVEAEGPDQVAAVEALADFLATLSESVSEVNNPQKE